ncbi:hypothetical protein GQ53DRAFT_803433 [Thozetella sp. PMI_491]|nr:hypothetical protein GQ53DRAFT_803433 [Thozetella sp. PMI_491]
MASNGGVGGQQAPRRKNPVGRPPMQDLAQDPSDEVSRRTRMRLSQRAYRQRRQTKLSSAQQRAARMEAALDKVVESFSELHSFATSAIAGRNSVDVALQLSRTALDIARVASEAKQDYSDGAASYGGCSYTPDREIGTVRRGKPNIDSNDGPSKIARGPNTGRPQAMSPASDQSGTELVDTGNPIQAAITARLATACTMQAFRYMVLAPHILAETLLPILWPAGRGEVPELMTSAIYDLTFRGVNTQRAQNGATRDRILPKMYRVVEGGASAPLPRASPPFLQRIHFGRTRTQVLTIIPELQGDWLEAQDVREYLESMGIRVPASSLENTTSTAGPKDLAIQHVSRSNPDRQKASEASDGELEWYRPSAYERFPRTPEGHNAWRNSSAAALIASEQDLSVFGMPVVGSTSPPSSTLTGLQSLVYPPSAEETIDLTPRGPPSRPGPTAMAESADEACAKITIDLDLLVQKMASSAVCIGPAPGIRKEDVDRALRESILVLA